LAWTTSALDPKSVVVGQRRRPRLLQKEVLARPQDLQRQGPVIQGARGEDDRIDVRAGEQLGVAGRRDPKSLPYLLGSTLPCGRDRDEFGSGKPLGVLGMEGAHPAETGDAEPEGTRRP